MCEKYLYVNNNFGVRRYLIVKENKLFFTIKINGLCEKKIYKSKMYNGKGWDVTNYYEETPELIQLYENTQVEIKFQIILSDIESSKKTTIDQKKEIIEFLKKYIKEDNNV